MRTHQESERHRVALKKKNEDAFLKRAERRQETARPLDGYALMRWEEKHLY